MSRPVAAVAAMVLAAALAGGCTSEAAPSDSPTAGITEIPAGEDDVASPELAALRERAGIADCPVTEVTHPPHEGGLPPLVLPCLGGGPDVHLDQLRGKPLVVNLWASWCGPCREELPLLKQLHERAGDNVRLLGVDFADPQPAAALELAAISGVTYPQVSDPDGQLRSPLRILGLPVTVLVGPDGRVAYTKYGPVLSYDELAGLVREHLGVSA